jgi:hypothetical protein
LLLALASILAEKFLPLEQFIAEWRKSSQHV